MIENHRQKQTEDLNRYLTKQVVQMVQKCMKSCPNVFVIMALEIKTHLLYYWKKFFKKLKWTTLAW